MPIRGLNIRPGLRLRMGQSVLAAAEVVDTSAVQERLHRFRHEHERYVVAQQKVEALERDVRAARARLVDCQRDQKDAIERLACALDFERGRARNPFAAFGMPSPTRIRRLPYAEECAAVYRLVGAVARNPPGPRSRNAARAVDDATRAVEGAFAGIARLEARARDARHTWDAIRYAWHAAYRALAAHARAAADDGAPQLHGILFGQPRRRRRRHAAAT